jgi:dolichyl-phosphate-mannose-protein mannosyltransferase
LNNPPPPTADLLAWFDRRRLWLWTLIALLMIIGFNGQWRILPDSAIHVTVARSLAEGTGLNHPTGLEHTVRPGLALVTAATFKLFGVDQFIAIDAVMLLCAAAVLVLTFWVIRLRYDRPTAVLIVCMLAVNETFYHHGYEILTDMPFLLGLMLLLLGLELHHRGGRQRWSGIAIIVASVPIMAAFRSVVITVLIAGALVAVYRIINDKTNRRSYLIATGLTLIGLVAAGLFMRGEAWLSDSAKALSLLGGDLGGTLGRVFTDNGPALISEHLPESMFGVDPGPWAGTPLGVLAIVMGLSLFKARPFWGMLAALFFLQWLLLITAGRYLLVLIPLLALSWWRLGYWFESRHKPAVTRWILVGLLVLWFGPNLIRVGSFITEQRARPFLADYKDGRYIALQAVAQELSALAEEGDVIIADNAPQLTYFTRLPVYGPASLPTHGQERDQTVQRVRNAPRILLVYPVGDRLNERIRQLKLRQEKVLSVVPTPGYDRSVTYTISQMWARVVDWENYRQQRQRRLARARAAEQSGSDPKEDPGQSEQPDDQPR